MIKAVIFDFDGVIADTGLDIVASVQAAQREFATEVLEYPEIMACVGHGAKYLIDGTMASLPENTLADALAWYKKYYEAHPCDHTRLYPGFYELLEKLQSQGIKMSIVSNKPEAITELIVNKLGISEFFTKVIGPESVKRMKPDPEGLLLCLSAMHTENKEALMIGDSYTDIMAGKAAGMKTCAILYGYGDKAKLKAENADFSASAASEILTGLAAL